MMKVTWTEGLSQDLKAIGVDVETELWELLQEEFEAVKQEHIRKVINDEA
jgi:hypothetical protein